LCSKDKTKITQRVWNRNFGQGNRLSLKKEDKTRKYKRRPKKERISKFKIKEIC
jgi:hypothetical protein